MKKQYLLFLFAFLIQFYALAQDEKEKNMAIRSCIERLFEGMKKSDTAMIRAAFYKEVRMQTILKQGADIATLKIQTENSIEGFLKSISQAVAGSLDERILSYEIKIDGSLASVWAPYEFYYNGNFSHCGVDAFQLCETKEGWKIFYIVDTRRKEDCGK